MDAPTRELLKQEALLSLSKYLATGVEGFRRKGLDRLHALNIDTSRCESNREGIEHLIAHVNAYC